MAKKDRFNFLEIGSQTGDKAVAAAGPESAEGAVRDGDLPVVDNTPFGPAHLIGPDDEPTARANSPATRQGATAYEHAGESYVQPEYDPFVSAQREMEREAARGVSTVHPPQTQAQKTYSGVEIRAVEMFGKRGCGIGEFNFPAGVAVDGAGILFVADVYNHRVQRITPDGGVSIIGTRGSGRMQFLAPTGVAVDAERSFFVVEQGNNRVQKFSAEGVLELVFGKIGGRAGEFRAPMGICVSPATGEILVADTGNGRVQRFTVSGQYLGSLGAAGSLQPPLTNPQAVTCDYFGNIYVADTLANRISRYDPMGRFTGHFGGILSQPITSLSPNVRFTEPHALACTPRGDLFIADGDSGPGRLVVMAADTGTVRASVEDPGRGIGRLGRPGGVALAPKIRTGYPDGIPRADVYLSDTMNHRIIRFTCT